MRNSKQRGVKRARHSRWFVWTKKVRKVRWHGVVRETLKAQASNFVLDPRFNWKPVECSKQWCSTHMPGFTEDYSGSMVLYALKFIQFVVWETSK